MFSKHLTLIMLLLTPYLAKAQNTLLDDTCYEKFFTQYQSSFHNETKNICPLATTFITTPKKVILKNNEYLFALSKGCKKILEGANKSFLAGVLGLSNSLINVFFITNKFHPNSIDFHSVSAFLKSSSDFAYIIHDILLSLDTQKNIRTITKIINSWKKDFDNYNDIIKLKIPYPNFYIFLLTSLNHAQLYLKWKNNRRGAAFFAGAATTLTLINYALAINIQNFALIQKHLYIITTQYLQAYSLYYAHHKTLGLFYLLEYVAQAYIKETT